jgi:hypothetical protein
MTLILNDPGQIECAISVVRIRLQNHSLRQVPPKREGPSGVFSLILNDLGVIKVCISVAISEAKIRLPLLFPL